MTTLTVFLHPKFHDRKVRAITWDIVKEETLSDTTMHKLVTLIKSAFPEDRMDMPPQLLPYWSVRNNLYILDGVVLMNDSVVVPSNLRSTVSASEYAGCNVRIIVPEKLRAEVVTTLHSAHQGVSGMNERAKLGVYWPGITHDIQMARATCTSCNNIAPSQARTPPIEPHIPTTPFEAIACDYFKYVGNYYFVAADRLSGWLELQQIKVGTNEAGAQGLCKAIRRLMVTFGVPVEISSDGGPEFKAAETTDFFTRWGIHHRKSSAYHPSSNGRAELAVKTAKRLLMDNVGPSGELNNDAMVQALLTYRNTPEPGCKLSPAQILLGRPLRDTLPYISKDVMVFNNTEVLPQWRDAWIAKEEALRTRYAKTLENLDEHSRALLPLRQGDHVMVQNQTGRFPKRWDKSGIVVETKNNDQYVVKTAGSGRLTLRNRRFLRKYTLAFTPSCSQPSSASSLVPPANPPVTESYQQKCPSVEHTLPQIQARVPLPSDPTALSVGSGGTLPSPQTDPRLLPTPTPRAPTHATPRRSQLTYDDHDEQASSPLDTSSQHVAPPRVSSRTRSQRTVYDASTGEYKEPSSVPDNV